MALVTQGQGRHVRPTPLGEQRVQTHVECVCLARPLAPLPAAVCPSQLLRRGLQHGTNSVLLLTAGLICPKRKGKTRGELGTSGTPLASAGGQREGRGILGHPPTPTTAHPKHMIMVREWGRPDLSYSHSPKQNNSRQSLALAMTTNTSEQRIQ